MARSSSLDRRGAYLVALDTGMFAERSLMAECLTIPKAARNRRLAEGVYCCHKVELETSSPKPFRVCLQLSPRAFMGDAAHVLLQIVIESSCIGQHQYFRHCCSLPIKVASPDLTSHLIAQATVQGLTEDVSAALASHALAQNGIPAHCQTQDAPAVLADHAPARESAKQVSSDVPARHAELQGLADDGSDLLADQATSHGQTKDESAKGAPAMLDSHSGLTENVSILSTGNSPAQGSISDVSYPHDVSYVLAGHSLAHESSHDAAVREAAPSPKRRNSPKRIASKPATPAAADGLSKSLSGPVKNVSGLLAGHALAHGTGHDAAVRLAGHARMHDGQHHVSGTLASHAAARG